MNKKIFSYLLVSFVCMLALFGCKNVSKPPEEIIVETPEQLNETAADNIKRTLQFALSNEGDIGDSVFIANTALIDLLYEKTSYTPFWSSSERWNPIADSLVAFIEHAKLYGLFPEDYHAPHLNDIRQRIKDDTLAQTARRNAVLWSRADLMLTDAYLHIVRDIKLGRLPKDSITLRKDTLLTDDFYEQQFNILMKAGAVVRNVRYLEPKHTGYHQLKAAIPKFLDSADYTEYTIVPSFKTDSVNYRRLLQKRLFEGGYIAYDSVAADSVILATAIKTFQKSKQIKADGKAGEATLRELNTTDRERFVRIAITLDKYKMLPEKMPERFIWVNLPAYNMRLQVNDTIKLNSKIICGKPRTRTPLLNSAISEIITYPQWTVPASIIEKEILPAVKRDPGYLALKGFSLINSDGEEVDPYTVDWSKYKKGIPYKVVQGSGDDNALGVLKFNFPNKYAVYLHDTNQRSLFAQTSRSLSHGCVRVQEWQKLALFMIRRDHGDSTKLYGAPPMEDSLFTWLERKEKHSIPVRNRLPVFIRYFTCEGKESGIAFYEDIYGEDRILQEKYFAGK